MSSQIKRVAVIGAGLMGHGIAQVSAQIAEFEVTLVDVEQKFLDKGMKMVRDSLSKFTAKGVIDKKKSEDTLARIHPTLNLDEVGKAHLVIEAATEEPKIKLDLFRRVSESIGRDTVFASNTSSISITLLGSATTHPENVVGMHFFNPPQLMPLIEVIKGTKTSDQTVQFIREVARMMKKETVLCKKDSPGFIVNRILIPALNEAAFLVHEGVADPEDIDKAVRLGLSWPIGPLRLLDYIGIDTSLNIAQVLTEEFQDSKYRVAPLLRQMVRAGLLGRKSGRGFYDWKEA